MCTTGGPGKKQQALVEGQKFLGPKQFGNAEAGGRTIPKMPSTFYDQHYDKLKHSQDAIATDTIWKFPEMGVPPDHLI